jgi:fermentation-respiration switch protein FrsA (DUF1100 family)
VPSTSRSAVAQRAEPTEEPGYIEQGRQFSSEVLGQYLPAVDLPAFETDFAVPVFFFQGALDLVTTTSVVRDYYDQITAPAKEFVTFPAGGHIAVFRIRTGFLESLVKTVRPYAID